MPTLRIFCCFNHGKPWCGGRLNENNKKINQHYLKGEFGAEFLRHLMNDLGVEAPAVVHVSYHDWERLQTKNRTFRRQQFLTKCVKERKGQRSAEYLSWSHLFSAHVGGPEAIGGLSQSAEH